MFAYHCSRTLSGRRRRSRFSRRDPAEKETSSQPSTAFLSNASGACPSRRSNVMLSSRPPDYESLGDFDFPKKKKKKGLAMRLSSGIGSVVEIPWRRARSLERGERGRKEPRARGERQPVVAQGGRRCGTSLPALAQKASSRGGASNADSSPSLVRPRQHRLAYEVGRGGDEERPTQEDARGASPDARAEG